MLRAARTNVADDLDCVRCGYNLRHQPWDGLCPECAAAVQDSALPAGFRFRSWRTIRRVRAGILLLIAAIGLDALRWLIAWWGYRHLFDQSPLLRLLTVEPRTQMLMLLASWTLVLTGIVVVAWFLDDPHDRIRRVLRRLALACAIIAGAGLLSSWAVWALPRSPLPPGLADMRGPEVGRVAGLLACVLIGGLLILTIERGREAWLQRVCVASFFGVVSMMWTFAPLSRLSAPPPLGVHRIVAVIELLVVIALALYAAKLRPPATSRCKSVGRR